MNLKNSGDSTGFEPVTSAMPVQCSNQLSYASAQVVETSVNNNSPSRDSNHPDDLFQSRYVTPGFKPFS